MRFPLKLTTNLTRYIAGKKIRGEKMFPLVMMLEPLHACNLTCTGCGRIREYKATINEMLSVDECLAAADDCGAPVVSICGGEPLIYPEIGRLTRELLDRGRHIYLCTNGMFIRKRLHEFKQTSSFFWNVHLDGMERTHDLILKRSTPQNIVIGGLAGALPPLVGWTAVTGQLNLIAVYLCLIIFYWTPPHTWALMLMVTKDYTRVRVPMLPVVRGEPETRRQIVLYSLLLVAITLIPFSLQGLGALYLIAALLLGSRFLYLAIKLLRDQSKATARRLYIYSNLYLALLFLAMVLDQSVLHFLL